MIVYNTIRPINNTKLDKPQVGSVWRHRRGALYTVEGYANEHTERHDEYPVMIRYRDEQGRVWTRTLARWWASMSFVRVAGTPDPEASPATERGPMPDAGTEADVAPPNTPSSEQWQTLIGWLDRRRAYPTVMINGEVAGDIADRLAAVSAAEAQPLFWVRLLGDGLYEGPIHKSQMDEARRQSGAWTPLILGSTP